MSRDPEPAVRSYFFGKGYSDLRNTIAASWQSNLDAANKHAKAADAALKLELPGTPFAAFWIAAAISVVVFGTAVFLVISVLHVALLLVCFFSIYVVFTLVYLVERGYLVLRRFYATCPYCHERTPLPEYLCPYCGAIHRRLVPNEYGILRRVCRCGCRLPTSFFLGRGRLQSQCAACHAGLDRAHSETRQLCMAIVGGPSVGKSAYLLALVTSLLREHLPAWGLTATFVTEQNEEEYRRAAGQASDGHVPDKTHDIIPRAFNLLLDRGGSRRLLYLYDPAGEAFHSIDGLVEHRFMRYTAGLVFLIDPFQIPEVRLEYADALSRAEAAIRPSRDSLEDTLTRLLLALEQHYGLGATSRVSWPVAVVLGKADAFDLAERLAPLGSASSIDSAQAASAHIRQQLLGWGENGFVHQLDARFSNVRYFQCSSLGRMPHSGAGAFVSKGVVEPVRWILHTADSGYGFPA